MPPRGNSFSILWNLVVDDLLKFSSKEIPGYLQAFADDLVTLAEGSDTGVILVAYAKKLSTLLRNGATPKDSTYAHCQLCYC